MRAGPSADVTRVFLHIGSPKTGTTFLQDVLWAQRDNARQQGLLLPMSGFNDHYLATLDVRGIAGDPAHPERAVGMWQRLVAEALEWPGDVLVSHELFAGATAEQATGAVAALADGGAEVHLVLTARDLDRQLTAEWQEHVKHRSTVSFSEFVASVREDGERASWFWQVQDFARLLERWGAGLPRERVHVVTVPPAGTPPTTLWRRFAGLLGLDPDAFDIDVPRSNTSLGMEQAELLRRVNAELGERLPIPGPYPGVAKNVLAHRILEPRPGTRIALDAEAARWAARESRAVADRLAAAGYDVIGDLGELDPATGPAGIGSAPDDGDLLDEAVAAVADLLEVLHEGQEANRRVAEATAAAREKPVRYALVQASERRPMLRRARTVYRHLRRRV